MERILIHPLAGVLSAYGIGIADVKAIRDASVLKPLGEDSWDALRDLEKRACEALIEQGIHHAQIQLNRTAGSETTLEIAVGTVAEMRAAFSELHRKRFGYVDEDAEVIVDALVVEGVAHTDVDFATPASAGHEIVNGPGLIFEPTSTVVVSTAWNPTPSIDA